MIVLAAIAGFIVLLLVGYAVTIARTSVASRSLSDAQDQAARLTRQQRQYAEVVRVEAESRTIRAELATLLANDLQWSHLLSSMQAAAPPGVVVTVVTGTLTPQARTAGKGASAAPAAGGSSVRTIGTLTISGTSPTKTALATFLDTLAKVTGLANPLLGNVNLQKTAQQFTLQVDITEAALDGRYTPAAGEQASQKASQQATKQPGQK
jgi:Tfp pilus assembly protein PilN